MEPRILQLVLQAQAGCRDAFNELARQFEGTVYAVALRRLKNEADAAELTQDVLIQAFRKISQLREPERFAGWLKRITVRMAINRAVRRGPEIPCDPVSFGSTESDGETPLADLIQAERADQLLRGLARLRELDRQTLLAFYFEGRTLIEMSDRFGSPVGTIKRRLHTARSRLKEVLPQLQLA